MLLNHFKHNLMAISSSIDINKIRKPRTHAGKKFLSSREPKLIEDIKNTIFIKGSTANDKCVKLMKDFCTLKKPNGIFFNKKHDWRPFEDSTHIEFLTIKNDSPLFMFASNSKKRPNNLIIGRTYDEHVLDLVEFGFENYKSLDEFRVPKISCGTKPIILFSGQPFDVESDYQRIKSLLLDVFSGPNVNSIRLSGLEHVIQFVAIDGKILMRSYKILLKKSGTRVPRIELQEIGPRVDLTLRRSRLASEDLFKRSLKQPEQLKKKNVKNINKNRLGSTLGRIHMNRQDYSKLKLRKVKVPKIDKSLQEKPAKTGKKRSIVPQSDNNDIANNPETNVNPKKKVRFSL